MWLISLAALLVVTADQFSKMWVRSYPEGQSIFKAGFFEIVHSQNTGAAFGLFQGHSFILTIFGLVSITVILAYVLLFYHRFPFLNSGLGGVALGLVVGGTIGNLADRIRLGYVTDFIGVSIWPTFNIADSAIVVGFIIFAFSLRSLAKASRN